MRVFIAGIMQGSRTDRDIDSQDYRRELTHLLHHHVPDVEVVDPLAMHPNSVAYGPDEARRTLLETIALAGEVDALVAYIPSASMGTAIEMWNAYQHSVPVYTITGMSANWVVLTLSHRVFPDIPTFADFVAEGGLTGNRP